MLVVYDLGLGFSIYDSDNNSRDLAPILGKESKPLKKLNSAKEHKVKIEGFTCSVFEKKLLRNILEDFEFAYGSEYVAHAKKRFPETSAVEAKSYERETFDPRSNTYLMFINAGCLVFAINKEFITTKAIDGGSKDGIRHRLLYCPMTLNKLLTGDNSKEPLLENITPYMSHEEKLIQRYWVGKEFTNELSEKRRISLCDLNTPTGPISGAW